MTVSEITYETEPQRDITTGQQLRESSWEILAAAGLDYSPKYIALKDAFNRAAPIDGLIRTTRGYYRLAEDTRNGRRVLLHSYERKQLTGVEKDGHIVLADDATDVYGIAARDSKRGALFRYLMERDTWQLSNMLQQDLNLHAEEMTIPSETPGVSPRRKIKLANKKVAYGIVETDEGKWRIRFYKNLRSTWDEAAGFTATSSEQKSVFTPYHYIVDKDNKIKEFDTLEDALTDARRRWRIESKDIFRGIETMSERSSGTINRNKNKLLSTFMWVKERYLLDWRRSLGWGTAVGFASTALSGTLLGALAAAGPILFWGTISKSLETTASALLKWLRKDSDTKKEQSKMLSEEIEHINNYLLDTKANHNRNLKKLDPEATKHLRLLSLEEADMMYDDEVPSPPERKWRDYERLSSASHRYHGAQFHTIYNAENDGLIMALYPNGLVSLIHVEKDQRATRHYVMYNRDLNVFGENETFKHMDPALTRLPGEGDVHKITHRQGKDFRYVPLSCDDFMADLSEKLGRSAQELKAFGIPIRKFFNCNACDGIAPRAVDALPIEHWETQQEAANDRGPALAARYG